MTVVFPFFQGDVPKLRDLIAWIKQLGGARNHSALLVADPATQWSDCLSLLGLTRAIFRDADFVCTEREVVGWPQGSNALFRKAIEEMAVRGQPFLWMEPDAIPLRSGWLDEIDAAYQRCERPFMGRIYGSTSHNTPPLMLSGIAVYPSDTIHRVGSLLSERAWDVSIANAIVPHAANTNLIQWFWGQPKLAPTFAHAKQHDSPINTFTLASLEKDAVLFHRNKDGTLMQLLERKLWEQGNGKAPPLTVVMPFCSKDSALAYKTLSWMKQLHSPLPRTLVLHYDASVPGTDALRIKNVASQVFQTVTISRYPTPRRPHVGWPAACNWAFRHGAGFMDQNIRTPWFWFEADAVAVKPNWLAQIEREYDYGKKPFMGSIIGDFDGLRMGHINGTAVYPVDAMSYFPKALGNIGYPWDAGMRDEMIHLAHRGNHLLQHCGAVIDGCCKPANGPQAHFSNQEDVARLVQPSTVFFHPDKTGSLIDRLRERKVSKPAS